ncbi:MAG: glycosyltransferase family 4 protein [Candidatus Marinimicrobia bacterium]|nr:glycosyltransferase family 4 protein [Candidatus Neomarinimicrobiota bacterium]
MRIGMVLDKKFPTDTRVENEAIALVEAGHNVSLLCVAYNKNEPQKENYKEIELYKVYRSDKANKRARGLINTIADYNTVYWAKKIKKFVIEENIKVLHIHDLFMFGAAIKANKKLNITLVGDTHENYVSGLMQYRFSTTFPGNLLISTKKWRKKEREWISKLDYAVTVIDEMKDRISEYIDKERIVVYPNVASNDLSKQDIDPSILERFKDKFVIQYVGAIDLHRGVDIVIKALPFLVKKIENIHFIIIGDGSTVGKLKKLASELDVQNYITFEGRVPENKIPSYCKASQIGLIPHLKSEQTDNSCPNKIFSYMAMGLPIITNDCKSLARLVTETKTGLVYKADAPIDLAKKVIELYRSPNTRKEMGISGKIAAGNKYNYAHQVQSLVGFYNKLSQ